MYTRKLLKFGGTGLRLSQNFHISPKIQNFSSQEKIVESIKNISEENKGAEEKAISDLERLFENYCIMETPIKVQSIDSKSDLETTKKLEIFSENFFNIIEKFKNEEFNSENSDPTLKKSGLGFSKVYMSDSPPELRHRFPKGRRVRFRDHGSKDSRFIGNLLNNLQGRLDLRKDVSSNLSFNSGKEYKNKINGLHPFVIELESMLIEFPFYSSIKSRGNKKTQKIKLNAKVSKISEVWKKYLQISRHEDSFSLLSQLSSSSMNILVDLVKRIEVDKSPIYSHKRVITVVEDMLKVGKPIKSNSVFVSYLKSLCDVGRYEDVISSISCILEISNDENEKDGYHASEINRFSEISQCFKNISIDTQILNYFLTAHLELCNFEEAYNVFKLLGNYYEKDSRLHRNAYTYCMIFKELVTKRSSSIPPLLSIDRSELAMEIYREMVQDIIISKDSNIDLASFELNSISLNVLLSSAMNNGFLDQGLEIFNDLTGFGVKINKSTLTILLMGISRIYNSRIKSLSLVQSEMNVYSQLIFNLYSKIYQSPQTRNLLDNVHSTSFIECLLEMKDPISAKKILGDMQISTHINQRPYLTTYFKFIKFYSNNGYFGDAIKCYSDLLSENRFYPSVPIFKSMYKSFSNLETQIVNGSIELDSIKSVYPLSIFHSRISYHIKGSNLNKALQDFKEMKSNANFIPDTLTFYLLFFGYHNAAKSTIRSIRMGTPLKFGTEIGLNMVLKSNMNSSNDGSQQKTLITEHPEHPRQIFRYAIGLQNITLIPPIYNLAISAMIGFGDFEGAQEAYNHMTAVSGFSPSADTYSVLIRMFLYRLDVQSADQLLSQFFEKASNNDLRINLLVYNSIIFASAKAGLIDLALEIYIYMVGRKCPILETNDFLMDLNLQNHEDDDVQISCHNNIFAIKAKPDSYTYHQLIKSFLTQNRPHEALILYDDMYRLLVIPDPELTAMLADGLEFNNMPDDAKRVLKQRNRRLRTIEKYLGIDQSVSFQMS
ncbi:Pentatricopeptide repeat-containing protein [Smittium mucronatum]|uniref:Pentatricopeptide repeat-containing protein n=1 Tax=Smittium mucronatum TaxID=133383 RepID=A0A1R0GW36_9FUNG|nr:Pentatricopeptide repeat-containing protein [Smittium mucronatum]